MALKDLAMSHTNILAMQLEGLQVDDDIVEFALTPADHKLVVAALRLIEPACNLVDEIASSGTHQRWKGLANALPAASNAETPPLPDDR